MTLTQQPHAPFEFLQCHFERFLTGFQNLHNFLQFVHGRFDRWFGVRFFLPATFALGHIVRSLVAHCFVATRAVKCLRQGETLCRNESIWKRLSRSLLRYPLSNPGSTVCSQTACRRHKRRRQNDVTAINAPDMGLLLLRNSCCTQQGHPSLSLLMHNRGRYPPQEPHPEVHDHVAVTVRAPTPALRSRTFPSREVLRVATPG